MPLTGCVSVPLTQVQQAGDVTLPLPSEKIPKAPTGDSRAETTNRVTLYYVSADQQQLAPLQQAIKLSGEEMLAEKVVSRLLEGKDYLAAGLKPIAPEGTRLNWLEQSQGVVTLDLSVDALEMDAQAMCWMEAAITNTLTRLPGIECVNILIGGKEETAMMLPTGTMRRTDLTLTALWAQQETDDKRFDAGPETAQIERDVTLYFAGWSDGRMLLEVRRVTLDTHEFSEVIIEELKKGPMTTSQAHAVLPNDAELIYTPDFDPLDDGRTVLKLAFSEGLFAQLERDGLSAWQLFGSLSLTLCRFIPELDGLRIWVGDNLVTEIVDGARHVALPEGVISPDLFDGAVGRVAKLYFSDGEGKLITVERLMDRQSATSARALLEALIAGPLVFDGGAKSVVPDGITSADLLGIRIEDRTALVNLSSNFYRLCQGLTRDEERSLIYAMVNTLCGLDGITRVRFYIAGEVADTLSQSVYLRGALMPNPGIVR